ncbi:hypothetical protein B9Y66_19200 [Stenotrophomonas maltophilia]|nr:hypothetical protein [Stenotrophomonas sp. PA-6-5C]PJL11171.1 hypothetical protein B9Y66_19200 [Stenotrophomonas maltophilia]
MNLWFRFLSTLVQAYFGRTLHSPLERSRLTFRVLSTDIDVNRHLTNSRYWSFFDLGRIEFLTRAGLVKQMIKRGWNPVIGTAAIQFKR